MAAPSLAELLAVRGPELAAYQDAVYANAYLAFVENVRSRKAENSPPETDPRANGPWRVIHGPFDIDPI